LDELGPIGVWQLFLLIADQLKNDSPMKQAIQNIGENMQSVVKNSRSSTFTPKLMKLIEILSQWKHSNDFCAIIFVEQR
jgi:hypothetical protein